MANPYHDANGKFCSRAEMSAEIDRLAQISDLHGYYELRQEMERIDGRTITLSRAAVSNSMSTILFESEGVITEEDIRQLYSTVDLQDPDLNIDVMMGIFNNENCPSNIKEDILANTPKKMREEMIFGMVAWESSATRENLKILAKGSLSDSSIRRLMETEQLTFDDKLALCRRSETGLAELAAAEPALFFANAQLEEELLTVAHNKGKEAIAEYKALALSPHEPTHIAVIMKSDPNLNEENNALVSLAKNPALRPTTAIYLIDKCKENNIASLSKVLYGINGNLPDNLKMANYNLHGSRFPIDQRELIPRYTKTFLARNPRKDTRKVPTFAKVQLKEAQKTWEEASFFPTAASEKLASSARKEAAQAQVDSFDEEYLPLRKAALKAVLTDNRSAPEIKRYRNASMYRIASFAQSEILDKLHGRV
jgi:hypothetical protein